MKTREQPQVLTLELWILQSLHWIDRSTRQLNYFKCQTLTRHQNPEKKIQVRQGV